MKKILSIVGTRPEVIKMAPVIRALEQDKDFKSVVVATAQHREILDQMLELFEIKPDVDLNVMQHNQSLAVLTSKISLALDKLFEEQMPDFVLAQGDTTTAFLVSLACFYRKIPFGHVEAGLRTHNRWDPFPEEMNRTLISELATLNFAPTEVARQNLHEIGIKDESIYVTGNTVIDALATILQKNIPLDPRIDFNKKVILVTTHRRENWGERLVSICHAIRAIADRNQDVQIVVSLHLNPNVRGTVLSELRGHPRILLLEPLSYETFVAVMKRSYLILSDSGGVQEEAPSMHVPVLVLRETTERPEGVTVGACKLVGTDSEHVIREAEILLNDPAARAKMIVKESPYGDGHAAIRIVNILKAYHLENAPKFEVKSTV